MKNEWKSVKVKKKFLEGNWKFYITGPLCQALDAASISQGWPDSQRAMRDLFEAMSGVLLSKWN